LQPGTNSVPLETNGFYEMPGYGIYTGSLYALAHPALPGYAVLEIREFTV
jgi:hypothetical protein